MLLSVSYHTHALRTDVGVESVIVSPCRENVALLSENWSFKDALLMGNSIRISLVLRSSIRRKMEAFQPCSLRVVVPDIDI